MMSAQTLKATTNTNISLLASTALVYKSRVTASYSLNQSEVKPEPIARSWAGVPTRFPALRVSCMYLCRVFIGSLDLVFILRHSIKNHSTALQRFDLKVEFAPFLYPISGKTKNNRDSLTWFPALRPGLRAFTLPNYDWLKGLPVFFVIGQSDYLRFSLTTLNWKPLSWKIEL